MHAAAASNFDLVEELADMEADLPLRDNENMNLFDLARRWKESFYEESVLLNILAKHGIRRSRILKFPDS
jgi:hypothetical protein